MHPGQQYLCDLSNGIQGATYEQLRDIVVTWLRNHPETRHLVGASIALTALQQAFCKK